MNWHKLGGKCPHCGRTATILEVVANRAGQIAFSMLCVVCGKELSVEFSMAEIIAQSALLDTRDPDPTIAMLENFHPEGPAN